MDRRGDASPSNCPPSQNSLLTAISNLLPTHKLAKLSRAAMSRIVNTNIAGLKLLKCGFGAMVCPPPSHSH